MSVPTLYNAPSVTASEAAAPIAQRTSSTPPVTVSVAPATSRWPSGSWSEATAASCATRARPPASMTASFAGTRPCDQFAASCQSATSAPTHRLSDVPTSAR